MSSSVLSVVFQPIVNLLDGTVLGYEALGRMKGREHEGFGPVREWMRTHQRGPSVWRTLQRMALAEGASRPWGTLLFLNVRLEDLDDLRAARAEWSDVVLEVPESDHRVDQWDVRLGPIRALGARIAVDDWGVGMADPLRLIQLNPNWLKIDQALVARLGESDVDRLVELLVRWVRPETQLIAEGVESLEHIHYLRQLGVRFGQGFALSRPGRIGVTHVSVPDLASRVGGLRRTSMALAQANGIRDAVLEEVEDGASLLAPIVADGVAKLADWITETMMRSRLLGVDRSHYLAALTRHFHALTRGRLAPEDVTRCERIARVHQQYGIDLSYYLTGYQRLQVHTATTLRDSGHAALAEAVLALFSWDQSMVVQAYQQLLDRDSLTGVLTRRAFWDRVTREMQQGLHDNRRFVFGLVDLDGFREINDRYGHVVGDRVLARVGHAFQNLMAGQYAVGRIGGDEFGVWMPYQRGGAGRREMGRVRDVLALGAPDVSFSLGLAVLGRDGSTLDALYERADHRLARARRMARSSAPG